MKTQNVFTQDTAPLSYDDATSLAIDDSYDIAQSSSDFRRQGVEIRTTKQYCAGVVKILSGERGHAVTPQPIGQNTSNTVVHAAAWTESAAFDPVQFVKSGWQEPFSISDDASDETLFDGVIDPLSVKRRLTLDSTSERLRRSAVNGDRSDSETSDVDGSSTSVAIVDEWLSRGISSAFVDSGISNRTASDAPSVSPFYDTNDVCYEIFNREFWPSESPPTVDTAVVVLLVKAGARGTSYVQSWQRAATAGFQYASTAGTDSVAFGDMTHV